MDRRLIPFFTLEQFITYHVALVCRSLFFFLMTTMTTLPAFLLHFPLYVVLSSKRFPKTFLLSLFVQINCFLLLILILLSLALFENFKIFFLFVNLFYCCIKIYKQKNFFLWAILFLLFFMIFFLLFFFCCAAVLLNAEK